MKQHQNTLQIRYLGVSQQIDISTLVNSLLHISTMVQEINQDLNSFYSSDQTIEIRVNAFSSGSFAVQLELAARTPETLIKYLVKENTQIPLEIIPSMVSLIEVKKFLAGKSPQKVEKLKSGKVALWRKDGQKMSVGRNVYLMYARNGNLNDALDKNFDTLAQDSNIGGFEISNGRVSSTIRIEREDFKTLSRQNEILVEDSDIAIIPGTRLTVFKIVFHDKYKWQFYYKGIKISARINDERFFKQIDEGKKFSKGDTLICELQINKIFDRSVNTYVNKSYQINRVFQHLPRPEQGKFDF